MEHDETGCQPAPEGPILCANNCGFFGSAANMNMCSKCYKDLVLSQEQAKFAASSIENIVNGSSSSSTSVVEKGSSLTEVATVKTDLVEVKALAIEASTSEPTPKAGPTRCNTCNKRVGLTGFKCRCGNFFCGSHRYSEKHDCSFDYRGAGQAAIAKANPVVKADRLDERI